MGADKNSSPKKELINLGTTNKKRKTNTRGLGKT
jgi:hypothetical protein